MINESQRIHETIVRDVYDVINNVKDFDEVEWVRKRNNTGSIARRASNLVLVFPVIASSSLSIQTATIISKAIERKCVSLLQILFSSMQLSDADNLYDYLKQFHTNLDLRSGLTLDDFISTIDTLADEGAITITDREAYEAVKEDMHNINFYLDTEYNPRAISDYRVKKNIYGESTVALNEETWKFGYGSASDAKNVAKFEKWKPNAQTRTTGVGATVTPPLSTQQPTQVPNAASVPNVNHASIKEKLMGKAASSGAGGGSGSRGSSKVNLANKDTTDYFRFQLTQADIDKANELMPTTMIVNFISSKDGQKIQMAGVIGVKAKLYPVDSMDIVTRVSSKYKDSNGLFNLVRASTREISFFKDLAFAIDKAKIDAINMARESNNSKMFKVLERRAAKNRFSTLLKKNDASPITSLVISQEEVEYLKKYNSIDMEKSYVTRSILERYNLMDIVIADESLETAKFLFDDGDSVFETLPFDALEKQAKDSSYKKVINLMSRLNR
jgi:hypothetical protein